MPHARTKSRNLNRLVPIVHDFKRYLYQAARLDRCGRNVASKVYWKLYAIENTIRIVIHSVLTAQIGPTWWAIAVDPTLAAQAARFRNSYVRSPRNANPGASDIYLVFLTDLTNILRANTHLFTPIIPDTNSWIASLEGIRLPRNLVGHMNFPNSYDRAQVDTAYSLLPSLIANLPAGGVPVLIPN